MEPLFWFLLRQVSCLCCSSSVGKLGESDVFRPKRANLIVERLRYTRNKCVWTGKLRGQWHAALVLRCVSKTQIQCRLLTVDDAASNFVCIAASRILSQRFSVPLFSYLNSTSPIISCTLRSDHLSESCIHGIVCANRVGVPVMVTLNSPRNGTIHGRTYVLPVSFRREADPRDLSTWTSARCVQRINSLFRTRPDTAGLTVLKLLARCLLVCVTNDYHYLMG